MSPPSFPPDNCYEHRFPDSPASGTGSPFARSDRALRFDQCWRERGYSRSRWRRIDARIAISARKTWLHVLDVLAQVELVKQNSKLLPTFAQTVTALDGKVIRVQGFMMPLDIGDKQRRFLLVAAPPHCSFCLPAGPDAMIEVRAKSDVRYGFDAVSLSGKLQVLKDDPAGLYYRLVDAVVAQ